MALVRVTARPPTGGYGSAESFTKIALSRAFHSIFTLHKKSLDSPPIPPPIPRMTAREPDGGMAWRRLVSLDDDAAQTDALAGCDSGCSPE